MHRFSNKELPPAKIETTVHLSKLVHDTKRKLRTQRAIKEIVKAGQKMMGTETVKIDQELNTAIWNRGRANPPTRVRIVYERKADNDESGKMITVASYVNVESFKGKKTEKVVDQ